MTTNSFLKCDVCDTRIRLRWQVGKEDVPVSILCPKCKCAIECNLHISPYKLYAEFDDLQGAKEIDGDDADYCQEISTEFFVSKMKMQSETSMITPFIRNADKIHEKREYISKIITVSDEVSIYKKELQQIYSLYSNKSFDYMKNKLAVSKDALMVLFKKNIKNASLINDADYHKYFEEYFKFGLKDIISNDSKASINSTLNDLSRAISLKRFDMQDFAKKLDDENFYNELMDKFMKLTIEYLDIFRALVPLYVEDFDLSDVDLVNNGITTISYTKLENLYKKCYEFIGHNCLLLIGLNNLNERGGINNFTNGTKDLFTTVNCCISKYNIFKDNVILGETFSDFFFGCLDNVVRNSEAHFSTSYDIMSQEVTFTNKNPKGVVTIMKKYLAEFAKDVATLYFKCYGLWCISARLNELHFEKNLNLNCKFAMK